MSFSHVFTYCVNVHLCRIPYSIDCMYRISLITPVTPNIVSRADLLRHSHLNGISSCFYFPRCVNGCTFQRLPAPPVITMQFNKFQALIYFCKTGIPMTHLLAPEIFETPDIEQAKNKEFIGYYTVCIRLILLNQYTFH